MENRYKSYNIVWVYIFNCVVVIGENIFVIDVWVIFLIIFYYVFDSWFYSFYMDNDICRS